MIFILMVTYEVLCFVVNLFPQGKKSMYNLFFVKLVPIFLCNVL